MVRVFAGDSTMTSFPRPALFVARDEPDAVDRLVALAVVRRGLAFVGSGIVFDGLRAMRVMKVRARRRIPLRRGAMPGTGRNLRHPFRGMSRRTKPRLPAEGTSAQ